MARGDVQLAESRQYRQPPSNNEAEQAFLAALLVNNACYDRVSDFLRPEHFALGVHGRIYLAAEKMIGRGQVANPVTLKNYFEQDEALQEVGGAQYLMRLASSVVTIINAEDYARSIVDLYKRRELLNVADDLADAVHNFDEDDGHRGAERLIQTVEQSLYAISSAHTRGGGVITAAVSCIAAMDLMEKTRRNGSKLIGAPSGIAELDELLGGFQDGLFYVLGGRPSMGKSSLARAAATAVARWFLLQNKDNPKRVLEFSIEMPHELVTQCRIAQWTGIELEHIKRGDFQPEQAEAVIQATQGIGRLPLFIDDTPRIHLHELGSRARRAKRSKAGLGLVVVDHIGKITVDAEVRRQGETAVINEITGYLQALAKELHVPVLALSQLSRDVEKREDKRPMLADLRQSGSIEQDADVVMFIYREEYYLVRSKPVQREGEKDEPFDARVRHHNNRLEAAHKRAEILVEKHRAGPIGTVQAFFDGKTSTICGLEAEENLPL